jgi:hypothetical protein
VRPPIWRILTRVIIRAMVVSRDPQLNMGSEQQQVLLIFFTGRAKICHL